MRKYLTCLIFSCYFLLGSGICIGQSSSSNIEIPTSYPNGNSSVTSNPYAQKHYAEIKKAEIAKEKERVQKEFEDRLAKLDAEVVKIGSIRQLAQLDVLNSRLLKLKTDFQNAKAKLELDFTKAEGEIDKEKAKVMQNQDN